MNAFHTLAQVVRIADWQAPHRANAKSAIAPAPRKGCRADPQVSMWPTTADDVVDWLLINGSQELPGHANTLERHARAAATLARRDGACDALIAAAVLHQLPCMADTADSHAAQLPMPWLRTLFPDAVLGPIRLMGAARTWLAMGDPASRQDFLKHEHASRALRLCRFEEAAHKPEAIDSALSWAALRPVLRRCALD